MILNIDDIFQQAFADHNNGNLKEAADGYQKVLSVEPDHPSALHLLGLIEFDRGNYEKSMPLVEKSLDLAPNELQWLLNYGKLLSKVGKYELSISAYQKALSIDPDCLDARMALIDLYCRLGEFQKALFLDPDCIFAKIALGDHYYDRGNFTEALKVYYNILCDNFNETGISDKYVNTLKAMGKLEEADRFMTRFEEKQKELSPRRDTKEGWN